MQPEHASFRQIDSSLEIDRKKTQYGEIDVPKLPFFFGEDSPFCPKSLNLLNQMDESVKEMYVCLGLLSGDWSHPVIEASKIDESTSTHPLRKETQRMTFQRTNMGVTSFTGFIWTWELTRQTRV